MRIKGFSYGVIGTLLVLFFALVAELFRFHGVLLIDIFTPIFVCTWLAQKFPKKEYLNWPDTLLPATLFFSLGLASLLVNSADMSSANFLDSAVYGVRWASFYALSIVVQNQSKSEKKIILVALAVFTLFLSLAGFIQLKFVPNFETFENLGWDPHKNRLLSTWFDPNFVGGFLAFMIPILFGTGLHNKKLRLPFFIIATVSLLALAFTFSRSAYLALLAAMFVFSLLRSLKVLIVTGIVCILLVSQISPIRLRVESLIESTKSVFTETYTLPDASARLRFNSWKEAWELFMEKPIFGQGYNRYKYAALEMGTLDDLEIHSASGSDSSLLNILATSGVLGFASYLAVYFILLINAWKNRKNTYALGFFSGLAGLFVHSIFVNSLLFPLIMAPFWISAGLLLPSKANE